MAKTKSLKQYTTIDRNKLKKARGSYSAAYVADILGVHRTAIYNWEKGANYPAQKHIVRLLELYGCTYESLLG